MSNLTTQTAKINAIISLKDRSFDDITSNITPKLLNWCESNCKLYAFILHDKDTLDNGELKTPHLHLVCLLNGSRWRLSTTLNNIADALKISEMAISIDKVSDFNGSIQYLIHKNNNDKYQYPLTDVVTNLKSGEIEVYLNSESGGVSLEVLINIIKRNRKITDIIREIGLNNYRIYRNVIWDIYSEVYLNGC